MGDRKALPAPPRPGVTSAGPAPQRPAGVANPAGLQFASKPGRGPVRREPPSLPAESPATPRSRPSIGQGGTAPGGALPATRPSTGAAPAVAAPGNTSSEPPKGRVVVPPAARQAPATSATTGRVESASAPRTRGNGSPRAAGHSRWTSTSRMATRPESRPFAGPSATGRAREPSRAGPRQARSSTAARTAEGLAERISPPGGGGPAPSASPSEPRPPDRARPWSWPPPREPAARRRIRESAADAGPETTLVGDGSEGAPRGGDREPEGADRRGVRRGDLPAGRLPGVALRPREPVPADDQDRGRRLPARLPAAQARRGDARRPAAPPADPGRGQVPRQRRGVPPEPRRRAARRGARSGRSSASCS